MTRTIASMRWTVLYHKMQPYLHIDQGRVAVDWHRSKKLSTITKEIVAYTRILKISIKNFKGFRNVRKSIETSDDISVATLTHHILRGSEVLYPMEDLWSSNILGLAMRCCYAGECGWLLETRRICIRSRNKMAALGYVYTLGKPTSHSPEHCTSRNATSAEFLEVQIPPRVLVYDLD